jgi:hypothetical protein
VPSNLVDFFRPEVIVTILRYRLVYRKSYFQCSLKNGGNDVQYLKLLLVIDSISGLRNLGQ